MKNRMETEHDKVIRLERQMDHLKFKQAKQLAKMTAENAVMDMMAVIIGEAPISVRVEDIKAMQGKWRVKIDEFEGTYLLSTEPIPEDAEVPDGQQETTDSKQAMVPSPDEAPDA